MSSIYIQEPPTSGKVLLKTTVGDIDVELWAKEAPKACRNFIQLCMEGYYDGTIFHRVVKGFIVQGGDPNGDGTGGESIYGEPFKDEFHQRLRFARRGLLAMANAGKDDNGSQFFFTLAATPELQNKHTIFGKVTGETLFNMLKLEECETDDDERPMYPQKILKVEILNNPFSDIVPRVSKEFEFKEPVKVKEKKKGVKNFKLLSFGEEAEEDEFESTSANQKYSTKGKSSHDMLKNDPTLDSTPAVDISEKSSKTSKQRNDEKEYLSDDQSDEEDRNEEDENKLTTEFVRNKLKSKTDNKKKLPTTSYYLGKDKQDERKRKAEEIRKEYRDLKKGISDEKKARLEADKKKDKEEEEKSKKKKVVDSFHEEQENYKKLTQAIPKKGASREEFTLNLLAKFQKKMTAAREKSSDELTDDKKNDNIEDDDDNDESWLSHKLQFEDKGAVLAKDASTKGDDWFEIYDPRNPLTKRRREESKKILSQKKR
ncbi:spliceosome-associated protein CWC27 homolog [Ctenocephalides felis]|uniref:spliceosome-associated protein CWC27 homolog n=2 Tax=Ctenocephalides felis TaxID=7515 RepID=UPI000E6E36E3|nr:spliceosome-associated protein CWC27 homolog [Ctenocephalides felis]